jgi:selenocysteine-specific elongation factor
MPHTIIGTAGHIDHGKTALVKALTGVDTDRLREEKERGLTIDLGFAHYGDRATIIDVPGHEKFIRNMVAGVATIDLVLFVVAADDGVMPQTREHLDILQLLQVKRGLIVITKSDLVDEDWLELVKDDVREAVRGTFLEKAPVIFVSAVTGRGIDDLRSALDHFLDAQEERASQGIFWMPVDRSFTMKGFGTIVTGSVLSGQVRVGETLELLPQGRRVRIRGLQTHNRDVDRVSTGDRAAINLQGVAKEEVERGNVLASPGYFQPSHRFDARLQLLKSARRPLRRNDRVRLHVGTQEVMARVQPLGVDQIEPGESGYVQFRLEHLAVARRLDPFVIRQYSPTVTIGGGVLLDPNAVRHRRSDPTVLQKLHALEQEDPAEALEKRLAASGLAVQTLEQLAAESGLPRDETAKLLAGLVDARRLVAFKKEGKPAYLHAVPFQRLQENIIEALARFHREQPLKLGLRRRELQDRLGMRIDGAVMQQAVETLKASGEIEEADGILRRAGHQVTLGPEQQALREKIARLLYDEGFATSSEAEMAAKLGADEAQVAEILGVMHSLGEVIRLEGGITFHPMRVEEAKRAIVRFLREHGELRVSQFKEAVAETSRKYSVPLLNHLDSLGITQRQGDVRVLGPKAE